MVATPEWNFMSRLLVLKQEVFHSLVNTLYVKVTKQLEWCVIESKGFLVSHIFKVQGQIIGIIELINVYLISNFQISLKDNTFTCTRYMYTVSYCTFTKYRVLHIKVKSMGFFNDTLKTKTMTMTSHIGPKLKPSLERVISLYLWKILKRVKNANQLILNLK